MEFDFIEIGTGDFGTLIEGAGPETVGLSIEPVRMYLDKLPCKPNVRKLCAAVCAENGWTTIHYLRPSVLTQFQFPEWAKGCSSVGKAHPTIAGHLENFRVPLDEGIIVEQVPAYTFGVLLDAFDVESVEFLKTDTEGHDCIIMQQVYNSITCGRLPRPAKISFESNELTPDERDIFRMRELFIELGYRQTSSGWPDTVMEL